MGPTVSRRKVGRRRLPALAGIAFLPLILASCAHGLRSDGEASAPADNVLMGPSVSGGSMAGNYLAGRFAQDHYDLASASNYLRLALAGDPENLELLQRTTLSLAAEGRLADAAVVAKELLRFDGESATASMLLAEQEAKSGNWAGAEQRVTGLPRRGLSAFLAPLVLAWAKYGEGHTDAALEALAPLGQTSNFAPLHDFHAALINDLADRRKAADQDYRNTLAGSGGLTLRTTEAAAAFYLRTNQPDKANEALTVYRRQHPDSLAMEPTATGSRPIDGPKAGLAEAFFGAAGSLHQGRAAEQALVFGRLALDLQPDFPLAQSTVADILQELGRLPAANEVLAGINKTAPVYWSARLRIAANLDELGDVDGAVATLRTLAAERPDRPEALILLGDVLRRHERWVEAAEAYDRAIASSGKADSSQWVLYYSRGIALERAKQWTRAETDFLKALELQPDQPHVLNYLGYSWIEQGINLEQARKMIEKAVEQRPTDGFMVDSLGWVLYRLGDYREAVVVLQKAVELHPEDATINDHLGDALWQAGRQEEARFQWRRALISNPEPDVKGGIDEKLKSGLKAAIPVAKKSAAQ